MEIKIELKSYKENNGEQKIKNRGVTMNIDPTTTKYLISANIVADGIVEKPDVVGAIFGQTEGLIGDELDLRDLQKSGRMGRIEVELESKKGKSEGTITMPSSLDQVETAILASALETIDRVGPCKAKIDIENIEDVRAVKKNKIIERAKELLSKIMNESKSAGVDLLESVRQSVQVEEIVTYGSEHLPAGPNVESSDAIIVVEGRSDVLNLLKYGIKNAIGAEGTNVPKTVQELSKERIVTAFVDGDRGGELILRELLQVAEIDFIARAPRGAEVEELTQKQIMKTLRNKIPAEQFVEMYNLDSELKNNFNSQKGKDSGPHKGGKQNQGRDNFPSRDSEKDKHTSGKPNFEQKNGADDKKKDNISTSELKFNANQVKFREILVSLNGSSKANLLNDKGTILKSVQVRDLTEILKKPPKDTSTVIFDGTVSQRLLDVAASNNIKKLIAMKMGNVTKQPTGIDIVIKSDLE
jgi:DNA primase